MLGALQKKLSRSSGAPVTQSSSNSGPSHGIVTAENITLRDSKFPEEVVDNAASEELPNEAAQDGVKKAEAITLSWSKSSLAAAYIL